MIFLQMGPVVVGWAEDTNGTARIFRWTIANGMQDFSTLRSDNEGLSEMYATFNRHEESNVCRKKPKKQKNLLTVSAAPPIRSTPPTRARDGESLRPARTRSSNAGGRRTGSRRMRGGVRCGNPAQRRVRGTPPGWQRCFPTHSAADEMNIGILGTGIVGQAIGSRLIQLGHEVRMGSLKGSDALPRSNVARMIRDDSAGRNGHDEKNCRYRTICKFLL